MASGAAYDYRDAAFIKMAIDLARRKRACVQIGDCLPNWLGENPAMSYGKTEEFDLNLPKGLLMRQFSIRNRRSAWFLYHKPLTANLMSCSVIFDSFDGVPKDETKAQGFPERAGNQDALQAIGYTTHELRLG
jgi:hypothetical protein